MESIKTTTQHRTILVVDHDADSVNEMRDLIDRQGAATAEFIYVKTVKEAMQQMAKVKVDQVILEVLLPILNGYLFLDWIAENHPKLPVLIYTRLHGDSDLDRLATYNVQNIFIKSLVKVSDLVSQVLSNTPLEVDLSRRILDLKSIFKASLNEGDKKQQKVLKCPRCGVVLNRQSKFCNNCGQKIFKKTVEKPKPPSVNKEEKPDKK